MSEQTFQGPRSTADVLCYRFREQTLEVLLVQRKYDPFQHHWAIPGGFVEPDETIGEAAKRELEEETGLSLEQLRQFQSYGGPDRDPRGPVLTVCYVGLLRPGHASAEAASDAEDTKWHDAHDPPELAFDHERILSDANQDLASRFSSAKDAFLLLPKPFTLDQLHRVYEEVLQSSLDRSTLTKRFVDNELIVPVSESDDLPVREARFELDHERFDHYRRTHMPFSF